MDKAIYFKSRTCAICSVLYPKLEAHFKSHYPLLDWEVVEIEKSPEVTAKYGIFTAPVLVVMFEGKEHFRWVRNFSIVEVDEKLDRTYHMKFD